MNAHRRDIATDSGYQWLYGDGVGAIRSIAVAVTPIVRRRIPPLKNIAETAETVANLLRTIANPLQRAPSAAVISHTAPIICLF